jgi:hypothetical protein
LYDALLEDYSEVSAQTTTDQEEFEASPADLIDDDSEETAVASADGAQETDGDADEIAAELLAAQEDADSWSDDPVRMYLTQMGEIPLLTRKQEIQLAKRIETTRAKFRHWLLECDYVIQTAAKVLRRVHDGELPFDRTVQVSVTDRLEKIRYSAGCRTTSRRCGRCWTATTATTGSRSARVKPRGVVVRHGPDLAINVAAPSSWWKSSACEPSGLSR